MKTPRSILLSLCLSACSLASYSDTDTVVRLDREDECAIVWVTGGDGHLEHSAFPGEPQECVQIQGAGRAVRTVYELSPLNEGLKVSVIRVPLERDRDLQLTCPVSCSDVKGISK